MGFKKVMQSDHQIIISSSDDDTDKFLPGFCYRIGGTVYTVKADVTQEASSPMREVILSDGSVEITPVESIKKDLREHDCEVLDPDKRYAPAPPVKEKVAKKKKVSKKKKKSKKND
jgi:hypothetical protein